MKKILILGSNGMIGSFLLHFLSKKFQVFGTSGHSSLDKNTKIYKFYINKKNDFFNVKKIINDCNPHLIINCIAILKKNSIKHSTTKNLLVNTIFPKFLNNYSYKKKFKLLHISTDCVFLGNSKKFYDEYSMPDAKDIYGYSKFLGEIYNRNTITVRTSIVGMEANKHFKGLIAWFMNKKDNSSVKGFVNAYFNGLTTLEFAKNVLDIIKNFNYYASFQLPIHMCSQKISKFSFLKKVKYVFSKNTKIVPVAKPNINRCLKSNIFAKSNKSWDRMLNDLKEYHNVYK
jgi:dTDP-4-dehydrorhamnose reductase